MFFIGLASFYAFYLIPLAIEEGSSPVTESPYEDANVYQDVIDEETTANEIGLDKVVIDIPKYPESGEAGRRVVVNLSSIDPQWLDGFQDAKLKFSFTSTDVFDFETDLPMRESDRLETDIVLPRPGLWMLELRLQGAKGSALVRRSQMIQ